MEYRVILHVDGQKTHTIVGRSVMLPTDGLMRYAGLKYETPGFVGQMRSGYGTYFAFDHPQMLGISVQPYGIMGEGILDPKRRIVSGHAYDIQKSSEMIDEFIEITGSVEAPIEEADLIRTCAFEIKANRAKKETKVIA